MILLDTNVVIGALSRRPTLLKERFDREVRGGDLAVSAVCVFELEYGIAKSLQPARSAQRLDGLLSLEIVIVGFDREDAWEAADIRAYLEKSGTPIGPYDVLIAAQARRRGAVLVTANTREFSRVPGLALQDWTAA